MSTAYVIPKPGLKVVDPALARTPQMFLPVEGRLVELNAYWTRRLADLDVSVGVEPAAGASDSTPSAA